MLKNSQVLDAAAQPAVIPMGFRALLSFPLALTKEGSFLRARNEERGLLYPLAGCISNRHCGD